MAKKFVNFGKIDILYSSLMFTYFMHKLIDIALCRNSMLRDICEMINIGFEKFRSYLDGNISQIL